MLVTYDEHGGFYVLVSSLSLLYYPPRCVLFIFFFSSRRRHTRCSRDWSSDVCSSDLKGNVLLSADYSQIELRVMAHFSKDPVLVEAFRNGEDIHARTAQEVFGVGPLGQTAEHRRAAKAINFGIIYGLSPFGLAQQLGIEQKEAAQFINAYFTRYRGVKEYLDNILAETRKTGVAKTLFGRIRPIPEITSPQVQLRNFAERTALNSPLQGTAADLIKMAMINIDRRLAEEEFEAKMILQVHDELLFEAPTKERAKLEKLVKEEMEGEIGRASCRERV